MIICTSPLLIVEKGAQFYISKNRQSLKFHCWPSEIYHPVRSFRWWQYMLNCMLFANHPTGIEISFLRFSFRITFQSRCTYCTYLYCNCIIVNDSLYRCITIILRQINCYNNKRFLRCSTLNILMSSSIVSHLHLKDLQNMVWFKA